MIRRGDRVVICNPNHKHAWKAGVLEEMDRGNVWVVLDNGTRICTRMDSLTKEKK